MKLPAQLRSAGKALINIKNEDQKCFVWYHVRHINHAKRLSERIRNDDKKFVNGLDYNGIEFSVQEKILSRLR